METETIDKLFLELSQVTTAKTARTIELEDWIRKAVHLLRGLHNYDNQRLYAEWSDKNKLEYFAAEASNLLATTPQE